MLASSYLDKNEKRVSRWHIVFIRFTDVKKYLLGWHYPFALTPAKIW